MAANWAPGLLAQLAVGIKELGGPLITISEFDQTIGRVADIHPESYGRFTALNTLNQANLARLPANHFVWSDDLVHAYSELIDATIGREAAWTSTMGIRWCPALGDCKSVIDECPSIDIPSQIDNAASTSCRIWHENKVFTIEFSGSTSNHKASLGLQYLEYLLRHTGKAISSLELSRLFNPPPSELLDAEVLEDPISDAEAGFGLHENMGFQEQIDQTAIRQSKKEIDRLKDLADDLRAKGRHVEAQQHDDQIQQITDYLISSTTHHRQPRNFNSDKERARKAVTNAIKRTIKDISLVTPDLGQHLQMHVKTGYECAYKPTPEIVWTD